MTNNSTHFETIKLLKKLGFNDQESSIYLALLNNGAMLPQHIAQATGIKRTTLYSVFPELIKNHLIIEQKQGKRRFFAPVSPDELFLDYESKYKELRDNLSQMASLYRMQGMKPKIEVYEGFEGIKKMYMDTIAEKGELLFYNRISKYQEDILNWVTDYYIPLRVKRGVNVRAIVTDEKEGKREMASGKEFLRESRFVPFNRFPFRIEANIYRDRISFFTCEKGGPQVGIIIENKMIAQTQRALFELAWIGAQNLENKGRG